MAGSPAAQRWISPVQLEGSLIRLELLEARHAPELFAVADLKLFEHLISSPPEWSVDGFTRDVEWMRSFPNDVAYAIVLKSTGRAIGRTALREIKQDRRGLEIGRTWIGREWHGTRVNPEAKYLMLRHVFEHTSPPAERVGLWTNITNIHSQHAIAKLGAMREGVLRRYFADPSRPDSPPKDIVVYSIIREDWPRVRAGLEARIAASV